MKRRISYYVAVFLGGWILLLDGLGQEAQNYNPPRGGTPRHFVDYSGLDSLPRETAYLKMKYIPVAKDNYLTFGGEIKYRYERFNNYRFGAAQQDPAGYLLHRYLLYADFHHKDWFRVFTQLNYTDVSWRNPEARAMDRDRLAINQLFLEFSRKLTNSSLYLRLGRREYVYGKSRWLSFREGPNTRLSFDGINLSWKSTAELELYLLAPVTINPHFFDNETAWNQKRIGFHLSSKHWIPKSQLDIYGLWFQSPDYLPFMGHAEGKMALGIREKVILTRLELDWELMLQLASGGNAATSAWMLGLDMRVQPWKEFDKLKLGMEALHTSGHSGLRSMTFQSLHPSNFNTKNIDLFGKHNLTYFQPFISFFPTARDFINVEVGYYMKSSKSDNVYNIPGFVLYDPEQYSASSLGTQINLVYSRFWNSFIQTQISYCRFQVSDDLARATSALPVDFFYLSTTLRF